jgi:hypothetical protein
VVKVSDASIVNVDVRNTYELLCVVGLTYMLFMLEVVQSLNKIIYFLLPQCYPITIISCCPCMIVIICRNPNLAKCGGEAQHLEKLGIWSPSGLPNV